MSDKFKQCWRGRIDAEELAADASRLHQIIKPYTESSQGLVIIGFCSDEGVARNKGRLGASKAPTALRKKLANLPWSPTRPVFDWGDIDCTNNELERAQQQLASAVQQNLEQGSFPFVLGGGHEVALGSWLGLMQFLTAQHGELSSSKKAIPSIGIINFDAHFDLRKATNGGSSGTPFYQIAKICEAEGMTFNYCCLGVSEIANTPALFKRADALKVSYRQDTEMQIAQLGQISAQLAEFMQRCDVLYLTIDLDVLPAWVAPGVSAPASHGVGLEVIEPLIRQIKATGKLVLAELAEFNPEFDIDNRTATVAARLFYQIVKESNCKEPNS